MPGRNFPQRSFSGLGQIQAQPTAPADIGANVQRRLSEALGVTNMNGNLSLSLISEAAAPAVALIVIGGIWIFRRRRVNAIPATLLSIGVGLSALLLLVVFAYSFDNPLAFKVKDSLVFIAGLPLLIYGGALFVLLRRAGISTAGMVVYCLVGLIPLYFIGGFVLISSACSFGAGGC